VSGSSGRPLGEPHASGAARARGARSGAPAAVPERAPLALSSASVPRLQRNAPDRRMAAQQCCSALAVPCVPGGVP